tara:strand:- start:619 stop:798 length:180 start_codon:yes stop_codon:yes gene_type:complete
MVDSSKIKHDLVRPVQKDYKNSSDYFQAVCKYIVLKFEDTYKDEKANPSYYVMSGKLKV